MDNSNSIDEILKSIKEHKQVAENPPKEDNKIDISLDDGFDIMSLFDSEPKEENVVEPVEQFVPVDEPEQDVFSTDDNSVTLSSAFDDEDVKLSSIIDDKKADDDEFVWVRNENKKSNAIYNLKKWLKDFDAKKIAANFKQNGIPRLKSKAKKMLTKRFIIAICIAVLVIIIAIVAPKVYQYSKTAYLKPYEEKYKIEYPVGILKDYCDLYGKNQHMQGELVIEDTKTHKYVSNQITDGYAYTHRGTDISADQQFMALDVNNLSNIEKIYSTPKGYLASTQKVTFNTLFEKADYHVVAAFYTNTVADDDSGYVFPYDCYGTMTAKSFKAYVDRIQHRSLYDTGYEFNSEDKFLSVSADSDFMDGFKFVLICVKCDKKVEKSDTATKNNNVHYPQIWYDEHKKQNPFRFASKWYPTIYTDIENNKTTKLSSTDFR